MTSAAPTILLAATTQAWIGVLLVLGLSPLAAWALRKLRFSGANIIAGIVVGLALGPGVFGRVAPDTSLRVFHGPPELAQRVVEIAREQAALTAAASRLAATAGDEQARLAARAEDARSRWREASERYRTPQTVATLVLASLVMLASGTLSRRQTARRSPVEATVLAGWGFLAPAALALLWMGAVHQELFSPASLALAGACGIGGWRVERVERAIAAGVEPGAAGTARLANHLMSGSAAMLVGVALLQSTSPAWAIAGASSIALHPLGAILRLPRPLHRGAATVALPALVTLAMVRIEPFLDFDLWPLVAVYLLAEDGRWVALTVGDRIAGHRRTLAAMRMALVPLAVGPTMAVAAAVAMVLGCISPSMAFSLLVASALVGSLSPTRYRVAKQLERISRHAAASNG